MIKNLLYYLSICTVLCIAAASVPNYVFAQKNLSSVNVDDLTDAQIRQYVAQVQASGLPLSQLEQVAQARGMSPEQVSKLKARIAKLNYGKFDKNNALSNNSRGSRTSYSDSTSMYSNPIDSVKQVQSLTDQALSMLQAKIFGSDLFKNTHITFEPNMRMATPLSYQIGPDDEILIDIYGYSEASYTLKVSPEGKINIPYVGLVTVGNMTMAQATQRIKSKLSATYKAIASGQTKVDVSLGNIRSIKVVITGEVQRPGTYTLSSLATVMNALYAAGGPAANGSYRAISVIRGGSTIGKVDVYEFLTTGELKNNIRLQDGDVIRIPPYINRVELIGEVKRPGIFEATKNETFADMLNYAGGFNEFAYKARIKVLQNTDTERKIQDVTIDQYNAYHPMTGDKVYIDKILDRFTNRVVIEGAVFRPGVYSLDENSSLKTLLQHAEGVKEDAYLERGYILRKKTNSESALVPFDLRTILEGKSDISLQREDSVQIKSIYDLKENFFVKIVGEVREPKELPYSEGMTLNDLILRTGGFKDNASRKRIEIAHRIRSKDTSNNNIAKVIDVDYAQGLSTTDKSYILQPFDIVSVRPATGYEIQQQVLVEGEVKYPGYYTIMRKNERISDIIERAGGLSQWAYAEGASLKRVGVSKSETDTSLLAKEKERIKLAQFRKLQNDANDTAKIDFSDEALRNDFVGINLEKILKKTDTHIDIFVQGGDVINIPVKYQTVKVSGEVLSPSKVIYSKGRGLKFYINNAGGFSNKADKRKVYVNYANGGVLGTRRMLFFRSYPVIKPGAEVFVPKRQERKRIGLGEIAGLSSAFASVAAIVITILRK